MNNPTRQLAKGNMKYRKKPVIIEARLWDETKTTLDVLKSMGMDDMRHSGHGDRPNEVKNLGIKTLEGTMNVQKGDFIIRGIKGEFYPCKPDIFAATYEPVD